MEIYYISSNIVILLLCLLVVSRYYLPAKRRVYELEKQLAIMNEKNIFLSEKLALHGNMKEQVVENTKAAMFDLSTQLSKNLIDDHRKELQESQRVSEKSISQTTSDLYKQFDNIIKSVSTLEQRVNDSSAITHDVKRALLHPAKYGKLAEISLENILKDSGLLPQKDFFIQHSIDYGKKRPDAVIFLPSDNIMIIDCKASQYFVELSDDADQNSELAVKITQSLNNHLKILVSKDYQDSVVDFYQEHKNKKYHISHTIMFLPNDSILEKIWKIVPGFMEKAWQHNILPVGPAGLLSMLAYAKFQIHSNMQQENYIKIIAEIRKLLKSTSILQDHGSKLGRSLTSSINHYDKFVASFNSNFIGSARRLEGMGVDLTKNKTLLDKSLHPINQHANHVDVIENALVEEEN